MKFVLMLLEAVVRILRSYFEQKKVWNDSELKDLVLDEIEMIREELSEPEVKTEDAEQSADVVHSYARGMYDNYKTEFTDKYGGYCRLNVVLDEICIDEPRGKSPVLHAYCHVVGGEHDGEKVEHLLFLGKGHQNLQAARLLNSRLNYGGCVTLKSGDDRKLCVRRVNRKLPGEYIYKAKFYPSRNGKGYPYLEFEGYSEAVKDESGLESQN